MKKLLIALSLAGLAVLGFSTVSAQYYSPSSYYYYYNGSNAVYSNGSYTNTYVNYPYYSPYAYSGGVGSYTAGCTTYYYNTRTGAQLYTQSICNNYSYPYQYSNYYNYNYTYPYYGNTQSQYCTYGYTNGSWYPCTSSNYWYGNTGYNYNYNYNYSGCYYNQYGAYVCY